MVTSGYGQGCLSHRPFAARSIGSAGGDSRSAGFHAHHRVITLQLAAVGWSSGAPFAHAVAGRGNSIHLILPAKPQPFDRFLAHK